MDTSERKVDGLRKIFLAEKFLLTINGHLHIVWRGVFGKNKSPPTYIGKLQRICEDIPLNSRKKLFPLNQGHENPKVRGA